MMRRFTTLLFLFLFAGTALARVITFIPSEDRGEGYSPCVIEKDGVTVTLSNGSAYFKYYQIYKGSSCTVHSQEGNIVRIVMHKAVTGEDVSYSPSGLTADVGNYEISLSNGLWNGDNETVVFTAYNNPVRVGSIDVVVYGGGPLQPPHILPSSDKVFYDPVEVSMWCSSDDAIIYYTTDGSEPTPASRKYTAPFTLTSTTTVKAISERNGEVSDVVTQTYTIEERMISIIELSSFPNGTHVTFKNDLTVVDVDYYLTFVWDETGYAVLNVNNSSYYPGDIMPAGLKAKCCNINGFALPEVENVTYNGPVKGYEPIVAEEITPAQVDCSRLGHFVVFRHVVLDPYAKLLIDDYGNECSVYQDFYFPMVIDDDPQDPVPDDYYAVVVAPGLVYLSRETVRYGLGSDYSEITDGKEVSISFDQTILYQHGDYTFAKDFTGYGLLYGKLPPMCTGDIYTASFKAQKMTVDGEVRLVDPKIETSPTRHEDVAPEEITVQDVTHDYWAHYVVMRDVTVGDCDGLSFILTDSNGSACDGYNAFEQALTAGHYDELKGIVDSYQTDEGEIRYRLLPILPQDTVEVRTLAELYELSGNQVAKFVGPLRTIYQHGVYLYVRDANGVDEMVLGRMDGSFINGDTIDNVICHWSDYYSDRLIVPMGQWTSSGHGIPVRPRVARISQLKDRIHQYLQVRNLTYESALYGGTFYTVSDETGQKMDLLNIYNVDMSQLVKKKKYDVTGFVYRITNGKPWFYLTEIKEHMMDGDVNGDNEVNIADVNAVLDVILNSHSAYNELSDVNGDGEVNIADVNSVLEVIFSTPTE